MNDTTTIGLLLIGNRIYAGGLDAALEEWLRESWSDACDSVVQTHENTSLSGVSSHPCMAALEQWSSEALPLTLRSLLPSLAIERHAGLEPLLARKANMGTVSGRSLCRLTLASVAPAGHLAGTTSVECAQSDDELSFRFTAPTPRMVSLLAARAKNWLAPAPSGPYDQKIPGVNPVEDVEQFNENDLKPMLLQFQRQLQARLGKLAGLSFKSLEEQRAFVRAVNFALDRLGAALSTGDGGYYRLSVHRNQSGSGTIFFQSATPGTKYGSATVPTADKLKVVLRPEVRPGGRYRSDAEAGFSSK